MRLAVLTTAFFVAACGTQPVNDCSPTTCSGCCVGTVCEPGTTVEKCGVSGQACDTCVDPQVCASGQCTAGTGGGAGGGTGGGGSGGGAAGCGTVPSNGVCTTPTSASYCVTPSGNAQPQLVTISCTVGEQCMLATGVAQCIPTGSCRVGQTRCAGAMMLQNCSGGAWVDAPCPNSGACIPNTIGAFCAPNIPTQTLSGTVSYASRTLNAALNDWTAPANVPSGGLLVISSVNGMAIDVTTTNAFGAYSIRVPATPSANDKVTFAAALGDGLGGLAMVVADPGFPAGTATPLTPSPSPKLWAWAGAVPTLLSTPNLNFTEALGSGALRVFESGRVALQRVQAQYGGRTGLPLVIWLGIGTDWSCGKCFVRAPADVGSLKFQSQLFIAGGTDLSFFSDAVNSHELGHWVMASFGIPAIEGGMHVLGGTVYPGMAWSEGFATWNSSDTRNSSLYFDKQQGSLFWLDIAARNHASGMAWTRPTAAAGLHQLLDENEVSAMIWHLTAGNSAASASVLAALASPKMTASPFVGRGYTQHTWTLQGTPPTISNVVDKGIPIPTVADLFDALVCGGFPPSAIDAATEPTVHYPYPSASPLCTSTCGTCAGCCSGGACQPGTTNAACGLGGSACVACGAGQTCTNGACTGGTACNAASCPNSCCAGNVCVPPSAGQCGSGGSICSACPAGAACDNGQCRRGLGQACGPSALCGSTLACAEQPIGSGAGFCRATCPSGAGCAAGFNCVTLASNKYCVPAPTASSQWKVVFYSADIKSTDSSGAAWDVGGGSPDPYLCATVGTAAGVCSTFKADTLTPLWNEQTSGAYSFGSLASTTLSLYDDDIAADDFIDSYVVDLRPPWAGQIWAYSFSHAADASKRSNTVVVALVPQ